MTEPVVVENSAKADAVQGAAPENLSGGQDHKGSRQPEDKGVSKPVVEHTPEEKEAAEKAAAAELLKKQGLADEEEEDGDKPDEEDTDKPAEWDGEYTKFDDESADSVVDLLKEAGVGGREAQLIFAKALETDNVDDVKWDVIKEKLGPAKAKLAEVAIRDYYSRVYSKHVATTNAAYEAVGGKENWEKVAKWSRTAQARDPSLKGQFDEIRAGINHGGKLAAFAVSELKALYEADTKNKGLGNSKVTRGDSGVDEGANGAPMSKREYHAAIKKAHADRASPAEIASIRARRQAGAKRGI